MVATGGCLHSMAQSHHHCSVESLCSIFSDATPKIEWIFGIVLCDRALHNCCRTHAHCIFSPCLRPLHGA